MPRLTKIYTRTGDAGETMLGDGSRVRKSDPRVDAYGEVDEANSVLGVAITLCGDESYHAAIREALTSAQQDLFDVGADLCVPVEPGEETGARLRITDAQVKRIERLIDEHNAGLKPLESFILPGGSPLAAHLHSARTVMRRAERRVAAMLDDDQDRTNPLTLVYLNRLSDLLFVLARVANRERGDVLWTPGANRGGAPES